MTPNTRPRRLIRIGLDRNIDINYDDDDTKKIYHFHAYLNFKSIHFLADVRDYLNSIYVDERIDVQLCPISRDVLNYVSKEGHDLLTNVTMTDLSFNYQAYPWAIRTQTFNHADPVVVRHHRNSRYLRHTKLI